MTTTVFHEVRHRALPSVDGGQLQRSVSVVELPLAYAVVLIAHMQSPKSSIDLIDTLVQPDMLLMISFSALLGYVGNWSAYSILKEKDSLAFQVLGNVKHCFIILTDLIRNEDVADVQICAGLFITLAGVALYSTPECLSSRCSRKVVVCSQGWLWLRTCRALHQVWSWLRTWRASHFVRV